MFPWELAGPVEVWNKTFGGVSHDPGGLGRLTTDGGFLITGLTYSYGAGGDMFLVKADFQPAPSSVTGPTEGAAWISGGL
jgi:hypothetical protein